MVWKIENICVFDMLTVTYSITQYDTESQTKYGSIQCVLRLKQPNELWERRGKLCNIKPECHFLPQGSREEWLGLILPKLSEILRLQDPGSLQLEIVTLAIHYPDIR